MLFIGGALILFFYMTLLFAVAILKHDNSVADIGYGLGFVLLALATYTMGEKGVLASLMSGLVLLWGMRLSLRIFFKNLGKPEDFRYKVWRESWGVWFLPRSYLQIFILQGIIIYMVSLPVTLVNAYGSAYFPTLSLVGLVLWVVGFVFESVGDYQLDRFIKNPESKGKIMQYGLWQYTRHPNYFGESLMWWSLALMSSNALFSVSNLWLLALMSPVLIMFLLLKVSGVPLLEKHFEGNPEWEAYKAKTSVFFPLPHRK